MYTAHRFGGNAKLSARVHLSEEAWVTALAMQTPVALLDCSRRTQRKTVIEPRCLAGQHADLSVVHQQIKNFLPHMKVAMRKRVAVLVCIRHIPHHAAWKCYAAAGQHVHWSAVLICHSNSLGHVYLFSIEGDIRATFRTPPTHLIAQTLSHYSL